VDAPECEKILKFGILIMIFHELFERLAYQTQLKRALTRNPVVALIGPRQCGKTTLGREILPPSHVNYCR